MKEVVKNYLESGYKEIKGFESNNDNLLAIQKIAAIQDDLGIKGNAAEIGVFHGRTAICLGLLLNDDEKLFAIDLFGKINEVVESPRTTGELIDLNFYGDGESIKKSFEDNCRHYSISPLIYEVNTMQVDPCSMEFMNVRLFSVDGGHDADTTEHDLRIASASLVDGGVIIIDDYFLEDCPDTSVGVNRFFNKQRLDIKPFLIFAGRVFCTHKKHSGNYIDRMLKSGLHYWPKFGKMFDEPVICLVGKETSKEQYDKDEIIFRETLSMFKSIKNYTTSPEVHSNFLSNAV